MMIMPCSHEILLLDYVSINIEQEKHNIESNANFDVWKITVCKDDTNAIYSDQLCA